MRYGIPDFKMEKYNIDRRIDQMEKEGVVFEKSVLVGKESKRCKELLGKVLSPEALENDFDAVLIAGGAEQPGTFLFQVDNYLESTLLWTFFLCKYDLCR